MRRNLLKITCLFLCFSCLTTASVYGQWSKKKSRNAEPPQETSEVEVLDNNPKNAENLHFLFSPFYWNAQNALDLNVRLEAYYRKNNEWSIGGFLQNLLPMTKALLRKVRPLLMAYKSQ